MGVGGAEQPGATKSMHAVWVQRVWVQRVRVQLIQGQRDPMSLVLVQAARQPSLTPSG
jgi:hypothetical protein